jgi:hypothetical protein
MQKTLTAVITALCLTPAPLLADDHSRNMEPTRSSGSPVKKLETDEALRTGMTSIARSVQTHWDAIWKSELKSADYLALAKSTRKELSAIVSTCKLRPEADRVFHDILHDMNRGVDLMESPRMELQRAGALAVGQALKNYGKHFDHPGWSWKL